MDKSTKQIKNILATINWRLYKALLFMGLCPTIYTTIRTFLIGQMPGEWAYSIAGQLSWVNLIYEVANEAIILPLFYFMGSVVEDREEFTNRLRTGISLSAKLYVSFSAVLMIFAVPLLRYMAASPDIIKESATYIRIESIAYIFCILYNFSLVALITINKSQAVYVLTICKLIITVLSDIFLISQMPISLKLGINGIGISNIITNMLLFAFCIWILKKNGYSIWGKTQKSNKWMRGLLRIGGMSGLESFVRNIAYMLMVVRMINIVNEQGVYWVANNFIWGWLLLPVTQLAELIKQEVSTDPKSVKKKSSGWFALTGLICMFWIICIPLYTPFMKYVLGYSDTEKLFTLVLVMLIPYIAYAVQNVCDATFYGAGRTDYMLLESVATNSIYYGCAFILYKMGVWTPSLLGIALLFGFGNIFDTIVTWLIYRHYLKTQTEEI